MMLLDGFVSSVPGEGGVQLHFGGLVGAGVQFRLLVGGAGERAARRRPRGRLRRLSGGVGAGRSRDDPPDRLQSGRARHGQGRRLRPRRQNSPPHRYEVQVQVQVEVEVEVEGKPIYNVPLPLLLP